MIEAQGPAKRFGGKLAVDHPIGGSVTVGGNQHGVLSMGRADVLAGADPVQAHLDDPGLLLAEAGKDNSKRARRRLLCSCRHGRDAHRHYRPGSDCALCECLRWSPWNPRLWLRRPGS